MATTAPQTPDWHVQAANQTRLAFGQAQVSTIYQDRNQYRVINSKFMCCQVNSLIALTDIGPGDGGTGRQRCRVDRTCAACRRSSG